MTYYRNVYERPDGTWRIGPEWESGVMATRRARRLHGRHVFVLRIQERPRIARNGGWTANCTAYVDPWPSVITRPI